jgi:hypothetical protein
MLDVEHIDHISDEMQSAHMHIGGARKNDGDLALHQVGRQRWQPIR